MWTPAIIVILYMYKPGNITYITWAVYALSLYAAVVALLWLRAIRARAIRAHLGLAGIELSIANLIFGNRDAKFTITSELIGMFLIL